jgi:hypothetical protein
MSSLSVYDWPKNSSFIPAFWFSTSQIHIMQIKEVYCLEGSSLSTTGWGRSQGMLSFSLSLSISIRWRDHRGALLETEWRRAEREQQRVEQTKNTSVLVLPESAAFSDALCSIYWNTGKIMPPMARMTWRLCTSIPTHRDARPWRHAARYHYS